MLKGHFITFWYYSFFPGILKGNSEYLTYVIVISNREYLGY